MTIAKELSGEVSLSLDGQDFVLRPSFAAIVAIEADVGRPLNVLADQAASMSMPLKDTAAIATHLIRAWGEANPSLPNGKVASQVDEARIGELVYEAGLPAIHARLAIVLYRALMAGVTAAGELKPPVTTKK